VAIIGSTPGGPALTIGGDDMALDDDDMTTPAEPQDSGTPADRAEGSMSEADYMGGDGGADGGADSGAEGPGSGTGDDDPTTETDEDTRFA
jgi:hypothetical protein